MLYSIFTQKKKKKRLATFIHYKKWRYFWDIILWHPVLKNQQSFLIVDFLEQSVTKWCLKNCLLFITFWTPFQIKLFVIFFETKHIDCVCNLNTQLLKQCLSQSHILRGNIQDVELCQFKLHLIGPMSKNGSDRQTDNLNGYWTIIVN